MITVTPTEVFVFIDDQREDYLLTIQKEGYTLAEPLYEGDYIVDIEAYPHDYNQAFLSGIDRYEGLHVRYTTRKEERKIRALLASEDYDCCLRPTIKEALLVFRPQMQQRIIEDLFRNGNAILLLKSK